MGMKRMHVNGVDLAYVEEGTGETVVFVHGACGDCRSWDPVRRYVAQSYRFVSLSRRYHYPNVWTDDGRRYSFDQHISDLAEFIRGLRAGKVHLVGNSYGGRMAGVLALEHPDLLRSVVLGEPSLALPQTNEGTVAFAAIQEDFGTVATAAKSGDAKSAAILLFDAVNQPHTFEGISVARQRGWLQNARTLRPMFAGKPAPTLTCERLRELRVPTLVVGGALSRSNFKHIE